MDFILRVVKQDGKLSIRKCFIDEDGEVEKVANDGFYIKADRMQDVVYFVEMMNNAIKQPIFTIPTARGKTWVDDREWLDVLEED